MDFITLYALSNVLRLLWVTGILPTIIVVLILMALWETYKIQIIIILSICVVLAVLLFYLNKYIDYVDYKNSTPEERKLKRMIKDWQNGVYSHDNYPTKFELEQQAIEKIKQLAQDYVKNFIAQGKTKFTEDELKEFAVIVKFKNNIKIPRLSQFSYKEHPFLLDILKDAYNKLKSN